MGKGPWTWTWPDPGPMVLAHTGTGLVRRAAEQLRCPGSDCRRHRRLYSGSPLAQFCDRSPLSGAVQPPPGWIERSELSGDSRTEPHRSQTAQTQRLDGPLSLWDRDRSATLRPGLLGACAPPLLRTGQLWSLADGGLRVGNGAHPGRRKPWPAKACAAESRGSKTCRWNCAGDRIDRPLTARGARFRTGAWRDGVLMPLARVDFIPSAQSQRALSSESKSADGSS